MKKQELHNLSEADLLAALQETQQDIVKWQDDILAGKEKNVKKVRLLRQAVARIKTMLRQKQPAASSVAKN